MNYPTTIALKERLFEYCPWCGHSLANPVRGEAAAAEAHSKECAKRFKAAVSAAVSA